MKKIEGDENWLRKKENLKTYKEFRNLSEKP